MPLPTFCSPFCDYCDDECLNDGPCPFAAYPYPTIEELISDYEQG